ncbi:MAG: S-layer homology domain-containing protein [Acidimicrobiia bacterium]|nr:S-layer homology domain-containing protein [Acidimicrobiia bacterium]
MTTLANRRLTIWRAVLLTVAVSLLVTLVAPTASQAAPPDAPASTDSVLVVAPHPADATIMAAGITSQLPSYAAGAGVTIAYMTNNDFDGLPAGADGQDEAVAAQTILGRTEATDLIFLGYPDGYLVDVWNTAEGSPGDPFTAPSTGKTETYAEHGVGGTDWFDYNNPGDVHAPYNKEAMVADMYELIDQRRPDHIFLGGPENLNEDYTTTYDVVDLALGQVIDADPSYGAVVHTTVVWHPDVLLHGTWPQDRDAATPIIEDVLLPSPPAAGKSLAENGLIWAEREEFEIPFAWQSDTDGNPKALAIAANVSQGGLGGFIGRFVHLDEIFWTEYRNFPEISIDDVAVTEGGDLEFTVSRTGALNFAASVTATTSDGTADAGDDYTANPGETVDLAVGEASATFTVTTLSDDIDEADETLTVTLTAPTGNATIDDATGVGTITDDDTAGVTVDEGDGLSVIEGGASDTYTVVLDSEPTANVVVTVSPDAQVTAAPSPLTFTPANWDTAQTVIVTGISDGTDETDPHPGVISHTAASTDANYSGITIADATADVIDATGLTIKVEGLTAGSTGVASMFTASVVEGGNGTVTYAWVVTRGATTVATGIGATLSFTPTAGGMHTVTVTPSDDDGSHAPVATPLNVLTDIEDSIFVLDIIWLADEGITAGCNPPTNDEFCPAKNVTRGQMAAFLVRFLGLTDDGGGNTFTDDDGSVFEDDIAKLAAAGITAGCNPPANDQFCPDNNVTRGQMAAFLVRALNLTDDGGGNTFTDDDGSIFEDDIAKLAAAGITTGCNADGTNFCPDSFVTRGQMAAFIRRAANLP